jgi:hypothetical protein
MAAQGKVIITSVNNAGAGIKSAIKDLTSLENNTVRIAKKIQQAFSVVAVGAAIKQVVDFGADTVKVFGELERNMVKLKTALGGNESAFKRMDDFISVTEKKSLDLGGSVESLVAELAALGRSETDIKKITEASVALANVTGDSLDSAFTKINATYSGTAGKLEKLVPELGNLTEEQLRAGGAVDLLNEKFGKISDAMAGGITQQTKNLGDAWGDFKEQVGKGLADEFSAILKGMNAFLKSMTEGLDRHQKYLKATAINATATDKLAYERSQLASQQAKQADYVKMGNQLVILQNAKDIEATEARIARLLHEQNREMRTGVTSVGADSTGYDEIKVPTFASPSPAHVIVDKINPYDLSVGFETAFNALDFENNFSPLTGAGAVGPQTDDGGFDLGLDSGFSDLLSFVKDLVAGFAALISSISVVNVLIAIIKLVMEGFMDSMGPAIDTVMKPLIDSFKMIGQIGSESLFPILNALAPLFSVLGNALLSVVGPLTDLLAPAISFVGAILSAVLIPIIKGLAVVIEILMAPIKWLGDLFQWVGKVLSDFAWNITHWFNQRNTAGKFSSDAFTGLDDRIQDIWNDTGSTVSPSDTLVGNDTPTNGASYTGSQHITFNFYNQGNVVGSGGLEELALLIDSILKRNARYA